MNCMIYKLLSLALALAASARVKSEAVPPLVKAILEAAAPVPVDDSTADWRPLHYKIYATKGEPMSVDEMRQSIEKLRAIYEQQVGTLMADKTMSIRRDKLKRIADSSNVSGRGGSGQSGCRERMNELNNLIEHNQPFQVNVVPFIRHNRRRLFGMCGDEFFSQAEEAVGRLSEDEAQIGDDFLAIMVTRPSLDELVDEKKLAARVNEILEVRKHISKDDAAKRVGDKTYESYYDQLVSASCGPFESKLREPIVGKYHLLEYGLDLFEDQHLLSKWLRYSQVCLSLSDNKKAIMGRSRLEFQDKHQPPGFIRGRR